VPIIIGKRKVYYGKGPYWSILGRRNIGPEPQKWTSSKLIICQLRSLPENNPLTKIIPLHNLPSGRTRNP
jgi:hypothetical protein